MASINKENGKGIVVEQMRFTRIRGTLYELHPPINYERIVNPDGTTTMSTGELFKITDLVEEQIAQKVLTPVRSPYPSAQTRQK